MNYKEAKSFIEDSEGVSASLEELISEEQNLKVFRDSLFSPYMIKVHAKFEDLKKINGVLPLALRDIAQDILTELECHSLDYDLTVKAQDLLKNKIHETRIEIKDHLNTLIARNALELIPTCITAVQLDFYVNYQGEEDK